MKYYCHSYGLETYRVGPREVVATHDLHVGLLQHGHPQLVLVVGEGAEQVSELAHWQRVIYYYL